jgi:short-subunit dehydrogenase
MENQFSIVSGATAGVGSLSVTILAKRGMKRLPFREKMKANF